MFYEIQSIEDLDNGQTRTVVSFWADRAAYIRDRDKTNPLLVEDFITNVQPTGTRIVTNSDGHWKLADGTFVDPGELDLKQQYEFEREEFEVDVAAVLIDNIERYIERNEDDIRVGKRIGDRTSQALAARELPAERRAAHLRDTKVRQIVRSPREARVREVVREPDDQPSDGRQVRG